MYCVARPLYTVWTACCEMQVPLPAMMDLSLATGILLVLRQAVTGYLRWQRQV